MAATFRSKTEGTNTSATTFTFDVPAGTVEGDFLWAQFALDIQAPTGVALTGGSDWTLFDSPACSGDGGSIWYYYKIAGASEPSTYQFTYTGAATRCAYACAAYEGVDTTTPIAASLVTNPNLGTPPSSPVSMAASAITTTADNQTVIYGGFVDWNSSTACAFTAPTELGGFTERAKQTPSSFVNCVLCEGTKTIAGSTGTVTATGTLAGAAGNYIATLVALNDAVPFSGQTSYPNADGTDGAWTPSTGADLYAVIDDDTDTEYITTSSNSTCRGGMAPLSTPIAGTQTFAFRASGSPAKKLIATLIEGASTSRGTVTVDPLTTTATGYSFSPSGISNYADLDWQFEVADATSPPANTVSYVGADAAFQYDNATSPLAVTYPATTVAGEKLLLFIGQKPSTANGGTVDASAFGTLVGSLTGANDGNTGGYGTTLGADTGNVNIYCYERDADGTEGGTSFNLTHTQNNVLWTRIIRVSNPYGAWATTTYTTGKDTSGGTSVSIVGAADPGFTTGDLAVVAFAIPTDVTTPNQFSAESLSASGATFGSITEVGEADSSTNNDIGGLLCYGSVTAGTSTGAPTFTATAGGTTTNVRGPAIIVRLRGATQTELGRVYTTKLTIPEADSGGSISGSASLTQGANTAAATGTLAIQGNASTTQGAHTLSATGQLAIQGTSTTTQGATTVAASGSGSTPITGSATITQGGNTCAATGTLALQGSASAGQDGNTVAAAGALSIQGNASIGQAANAVAAAGQVAVQGTASLSQSGNSVATTGVLAVAGTASTAQGSNAVSATGQLPITGSSSVAQGANALAAAGSGAAGNTGSAAIAQAQNTLAAAGTLSIQGNASIGQAANTVSASGQISIQGTASLSQAGNSVATTGVLAVAGAASTAQGANAVSAAGSGAAGNTGSAAIAQASNTLAAAGTLPIQGSASISQGGNTLSAIGTVAIIGTLAIQLDDSAVAATGQITLTGSLASLQAEHSLNAIGQVPIIGTLATQLDGHALWATGRISLAEEPPRYFVAADLTSSIVADRPSQQCIADLVVAASASLRTPTAAANHQAAITVEI